MRGLPRGRALIGRADDLARVVDAIGSGARLVTLLGPPGIGKTALAAGACADLEPRFRGGVAFVDLTSARSEGDLAFAVLAALTSRTQVVEAASPAVVAALLEDRAPTLLVLDNFEHLVFAAHAVDAWLLASPALVVLVTSRERLAIDGERAIEIAPLSCPAEGASRDDVITSSAVALFLARAKDAGARATEEIDDVAEIVRRLDGIPLAIELAAARSRLLSPKELAERLLRGDDILRNAEKRAHPRHRTLMDAINWSWDLLSDVEQRALACVSVFPASFTIEAGEAVILHAIGVAQAVDVFGALRDKSLVHATDDGRLGLYQSIRDVARHKLRELDQAVGFEASLAHARFFGALARRFVASRFFEDNRPDPTLHSSARRERDHFVAALSFLGAAQKEPGIRADIAASVALLFALPSEAMEHELRDAISAIDDAPDPDFVARGRAMVARQSTLNGQGRYDESLALARATFDDPKVPRSLGIFSIVGAGVLHRARGDASGAWKLHVEAARYLAETTDLQRLTGMNTACMGRLECDLSHTKEARILNARATEICDAIGDRWLAALGLANLAQLEQEEGELDRALDLLTRALDRFRETAEPQYEGIYAGMCGGLHLERKDFERARAWYDLAREKLDGLIAPFPRVVIHGGSAALEALSGNLSGADTELALARRSAARAPSDVARLILEAHASTVEICRAAAAKGPALARLTEEIRSHLDELRRPGGDGDVLRSNIDARFAVRVLERALASRLAFSAGPTDKALAVLRSPEDGLWFSLDGGPRVDLGRRGSLRRMFCALRDEQLAHPGRTLSAEILTARGWPNERILVEAASTRVRVAIATLRKLGLRSVLLTRDDGYLLDPDVEVELG